MTDKEKLIALLTEFGVGMEVADTYVECESGSTKVGGYMCFYTLFEFDEQGAFITMGAWE